MNTGNKFNFDPSLNHDGLVDPGKVEHSERPGLPDFESILEGLTQRIKAASRYMEMVPVDEAGQQEHTVEAAEQQ